MINKATKSTINKAILCIFILIFIIIISPINLQNDTFFDIVIGQEYIENGMFTIDKFSIHDGLVYQTHHYFVNLIIYAIYNSLGFLGLYLFQIILTCIIAVLFYMLNNTFTKSKKISYTLVFLEMFMFSVFISLRAQMFSSIIFLIELLLIQKYLYGNVSKKVSNIVLAILTLMPVILINSHSGVIFFYYIIIGVYLINFLKLKFIRIENDESIKKDKLIKLLICSIISLPLLILNPYGINGITYMSKTLNNSFINSNIQEFQPFSLSTMVGVYIIAYFFIHIMSLILSDRKIKIHEILFLLGTMFMCLLSIRHFVFYIITTIVLIPHVEYVVTRIKSWIYNGLTEKGHTVMNITVGFMIFFVITSIMIGKLTNKKYEYIPADLYPVEATEYIKDNIGYNKVIFNEYTWGSYMMLNNIKSFIDSRCDLYTEEYNKGVTIAHDYVNTIKCKIHYDETVSKYNIEYFFIRKKEPLAIMLLKDHDYEKIYEDDISYIFMKK